MGRKRKAEFELLPGRLWPNTPSGSPLEIEVFGATGEYKAGKTILGLSIAPGVHPEGHPFAGKERTLYLDFEKGGGTYGGTGCKRIDVPIEMQKLFAQESGQVRQYGPLDVFEWFLRMLDSIPPARFDVIMADPATDLESGMGEYVRRHHDQFGMTANQMAKAGGLFWGALKDHLKQTLLKLSSRCKCFYFTSHLRSVWDGDKPVRGKKEPKGKETLMELATLYLWLERKPDENGVVLEKPSGIVLKERLADTVVHADGTLDVIPLMPPRIAEATVEAIRGYIAKPPDYAKLRDGERVIEEKLSEDARLQLQADIADAQRDTEQSRLQTISRQAELQALARQAEQEAPQPTDQTARRLAEKEAAELARVGAKAEEIAPGGQYPDSEGKRLMEGQSGNGSAAATAAAATPDYAITAEQRAEIKKLVVALELSKGDLVKILGRVNCVKVPELSRELAAKLIASLTKRWVNAGN